MSLSRSGPPEVHTQGSVGKDTQAKAIDGQAFIVRTIYGHGECRPRERQIVPVNPSVHRACTLTPFGWGKPGIRQKGYPWPLESRREGADASSKEASKSPIGVLPRRVRRALAYSRRVPKNSGARSHRKEASDESFGNGPSRLYRFSDGTAAPASGPCGVWL